LLACLPQETGNEKQAPISRQPTHLHAPPQPADDGCKGGGAHSQGRILERSQQLLNDLHNTLRTRSMGQQQCMSGTNEVVQHESPAMHLGADTA
jgi:hypothetical protein